MTNALMRALWAKNKNFNPRALTMSNSLQMTLWAKYGNGGSSTPHRYGVKWDLRNAQCVRTYDAADITTDITHFAHRGSVDPSYSNPFDSMYPWSGRKLCNISIDLYMALQPGDSIKNCVTYWEDESGFSYNDQYGVWVYTPAFWGQTSEEGNYRYFDVADSPIEGFIFYPEMITGRWNGTIKTITINGSSKKCLFPLAEDIGMPPNDGAVTYGNLKTYAQNYGGTLEDIYALDASLLLMVVEYATLNSQDACGQGACNYLTARITEVKSTTNIVLQAANAAQKANLVEGAIVSYGSNQNVQRGIIDYVQPLETVYSRVYLKSAMNNLRTGMTMTVEGVYTSKGNDIGSKSGYIGTNGQSIAYYRGEQLWGNQMRYVLGAYKKYTSYNVYITTRDGQEEIDSGANVPNKNGSGYITTLYTVQGLSIPPFSFGPTSMSSGTEVKPVGDYLQAPTNNNTDAILLVGGCPKWSYNASVGKIGAFAVDWSITSAGTPIDCSQGARSGRPILKNP